jgi:glycosyltransferase involved in cell wall biosynthesis
MKVCHLFPAVMLDDGPSNVLLALLGELAKRGVENVVVALKPAPRGRSPRMAIERTGSEYIELTMGPSMLDFTVLPGLVRILRKEKPDVLQCNLIRANLYGKLAARLAGGVPVIAVAHNMEQYMESSDAVSRITRFAERRTRAMAAAQVSVSDAVAGMVAGVLGVNAEAVEVIQNGIGPIQNASPREESCKLLGIPRDLVVVGTVGRLHAQKNYPLLLRAVACASARMRDLRLVIIGDGEESENLRALAAELGVDRLVYWTGRRSDVQQVMSALDIFAMTSDYEGLPIALIEAMRAGIPCVVTRAGGMPEAVIDGETGYVVDRRDLEGVSRALLTLAGDPTLRVAMGRAAKARFHSHYSAERMTSEYMKLYGQIQTSVPPKRKPCVAEENH